MASAVRALLTISILAVLAACGGGGGSEPAPAAPAARVASRVVAGPSAVLLTGIGSVRGLTAQVFDAGGSSLSTAVNWSSSAPGVVAVDANGNVRALVGAGNAYVTASAGALSAEPVLVTIAQPRAGAQLVTDAQVVAGPTGVADPAAGHVFDVVLRGIAAPAVGTLLIASEAANIAGRVVSVQSDGSNLRVRLALVPPTQLFSDFAFRDRVDLTKGTIDVPADLRALYDVVRTGNTFVFTPKPGAAATKTLPSAADGRRVRPSAAIGTSALPPLPPFHECGADTDFGEGRPIPLALSATTPTFEVTVDGTAEREATPEGSRISVKGSPTFKFSMTFEIKSAYEFKISCKLTLAQRSFQPPGWAGVIFSGKVLFGTGFEAGGKLTLLNAKLGGSATLATTLSAILDCPAASGSCSMTGDASAQADPKLELQVPGIESAQFEPAVNLFGFVELEAGPPIDLLQFKALEAKVGAELAASLTLEALQIANTDADSGRSKYALAIKGEVAPGVEFTKFLEVMQVIGLGEVSLLKLTFSTPLGDSPTAVTVIADRDRYLPGERASVMVTLTPASTRFPLGLLYNVGRVQLRRRIGLDTQVLAERSPTEGQMQFSFEFDSPALLSAGEIVAFVMTPGLPALPALELGAARCTTNCGNLVVSPETVRLEPGGRRTFVASIGGQPTAAVTWSASGGTVDATGNYLAPSESGTYTVTAASTTSSANQASAIVTVQDICPLFTMTVPGKTAATREFSGLSLGYATGGGAIGGTNVLSLTAFAGSLSAQSTLYYLVEVRAPSTSPVNIVVTWSGNATVEAGGAEVAMAVNGVGDSATASATGPLLLNIPVQVSDKDLLKVTFRGSATSPEPDKNVNPRGSMITNSFPAGVSLRPVTCGS